MDQQIVQLVLSGLVIGAIYALIALGMMVIHNVTGILNFAQGDFAMLGGMIAIWLVNLQLPLLASGAIAVLMVGSLGGLLHAAIIRPAHRASVLTKIILTLGASILIEGMALLLWGSNAIPLPSFSGDRPVRLADVTLPTQGLWVFGLTALTLLGLFLFFEGTMTGKALRACAINPFAAALVGVRTERMGTIAFVLSASTTALAGVVMAPMTMAAFNMGLMLALKGFVGLIVGGMDKPAGVVLGGLSLGVAESLMAGLVSSGYKDGIAFAILVAALLIRTSGLFRRAEYAQGSL